MTGYRTALDIAASPERVLASVTDPRAWWVEAITGDTRSPGGEFVFDIPGVHWSRIAVAESGPERVVWNVAEARIEYVADKDEWTGTRIEFTIEPTREGTRLSFEHQGLMPALECYDTCSQVWATLVHSSLRGLITDGVGDPYRQAASA
jgi:hypothetical protein